MRGADDASSNVARVALTEQAVAPDASGRASLGARLRTTSLAGTPDAPVRNSRLVVENRSPVLYAYVTGWVTFYDGEGIRCGEGLFKLEALAPNESAEVDTPGLRLTCTPATWRIVATNLLTRSNSSQPSAPPAPPPAQPSTPEPALTIAPVLPPLEININGKTLPIQPGNPLEIIVGAERVRIILSPAP